MSELRDQLTAALDEGYISDPEFESLDSQLENLAKQINAYISAIKREPVRKETF